MSHEHELHEVPFGDVDGVNTDFELANTPVTGSVRFFVNGIEQKPDTAYTVSGTTITTTTAPRADAGDGLPDRLKAHYERAT